MASQVQAGMASSPGLSSGGRTACRGWRVVLLVLSSAFLREGRRAPPRDGGDVVLFCPALPGRWSVWSGSSQGTPPGQAVFLFYNCCYLHQSACNLLYISSQGSFLQRTSNLESFSAVACARTSFARTRVDQVIDQIFCTFASFTYIVVLGRRRCRRTSNSTSSGHHTEHLLSHIACSCAASSVKNVDVNSSGSSISFCRAEACRGSISKISARD